MNSKNKKKSTSKVNKSIQSLNKTNIKSKTKVFQMQKPKIKINDQTTLKGNNNKYQKSSLTKKTQLYKIKVQQKNLNNILMNIDDSSTNCLSKSNKKNIISKNEINNNIKKIAKKDNYIYPYTSLMSPRQSEGESLFINFKLGEKESTFKSDSENIFSECKNIKLVKTTYNNVNTFINSKSFAYTYCDVDKTIGQDESDSLEIYDFTDKANVDYVLKNLSLLSLSKDKSSLILEDINEEDVSLDKKIKIFSTKPNSSIINSIQRIEV